MYSSMHVYEKADSEDKLTCITPEDSFYFATQSRQGHRLTSTFARSDINTKINLWLGDCAGGNACKSHTGQHTFIGFFTS